MVYIPKGEHDNCHELPQQPDLEGSTKIEHTLYSHSDTIVPTPNSLQKLEYIYQHFQDNEKIYESDPNLASCETDNTLYPHINNDIEYGLFGDVIDSYYLDSQIKDDFMCNQNCYTKTQHIQQDQTLTPCTHAYNHITQHIDIQKIQNSSTQYILMKLMHHYLLWIPPHHMIIILVLIYQIQITFRKIKLIPYNQGEYIPKVNINTEMFSAILTSNIMISIMVMHSLLRTNIQYYYNKNYKTLILPLNVYNKYPILQKYKKTENHTPIYMGGGMIVSLLDRDTFETRQSNNSK